MTRPEFAQIIAYLTAGCGKPLADAALEVYFDLLGDLPFDAMKLAAQRVLLEHRWATFPSIAELREAATATMRGQVAALSPAEAWALAWDAAGRIDPEQEGSAERGLRDLPPLVVEAIRAFGLPALCYGQEPVGVVRAQFTKIYEQLAAREQRTALLPHKTAEAVRQRLPQQVAGILQNIGIQP